MAFFYVANPSTAQALYQVNGAALLPGRPFAPGPVPPFGTPSFVMAPLGRLPEAGVVGPGDNTLSARFVDQRPEKPYVFGFSVPDGWSVDDAIVAYAFRGALLLMDHLGQRLRGNPFPIVAPPAPASPNP